MTEITVHVREGKVEIEIRTDKVGKLTLEPSDAMSLGIKLLKAAYAAGV